MQNLTEGSIFKVLMKLSLPIMASAFLATAYSITDLAWIGSLGSGAVAGVGVGGMCLAFSRACHTSPYGRTGSCCSGAWKGKP